MLTGSALWLMQAQPYQPLCYIMASLQVCHTNPLLLSPLRPWNSFALPTTAACTFKYKPMWSHCVTYTVKGLSSQCPHLPLIYNDAGWIQSTPLKTILYYFQCLHSNLCSSWIYGCWGTVSWLTILGAHKPLPSMHVHPPWQTTTAVQDDVCYGQQWLPEEGFSPLFTQDRHSLPVSVSYQQVNVPSLIITTSRRHILNNSPRRKHHTALSPR